MNNIELHLPHQHTAQNFTNNNNINSTNQNSENIIKNLQNNMHHIKTNSLPTVSIISEKLLQNNISPSNMETNDTELEIVSPSSSEILIMEDDNNDDDLSFKTHSQNQHYHYKQHRPLRTNSHRGSSFSRTASKPIDIRISKTSLALNEFMEQTSKLYYVTAPSHFKHVSPLNTAQLNKTAKQQTQTTAQVNGFPLILNAEPLTFINTKQSEVTVSNQPSTALTENIEKNKLTYNNTNQSQNHNKHQLQYKRYQQYQKTLIKFKNFSNENLNLFRPCMFEEVNHNETDELYSIECNKENTEQKTNNIKEAKTNSRFFIKNDCFFEGNTNLNCEDEFYDDDGSIFSCDEENNSLNGEISGKKNFNNLNYWAKSADGFPTPTHFFSIGDIIGYSKVVRAERNEALGQLNDAIGRFSTEWPTIRKDWELNLQRIGQFHEYNLNNKNN